MSSDSAINPRGIFNRAVKGKSLEPVTVQIERGRIRFFAQVLGETDPIHFDVEAARAAGHPDLVASASFFVVAEAAASEERIRHGHASALDFVRCDFRYLLHGDERYVYEAPIYAGEELTHTTNVIDSYDKKGGAMEFVTLESALTHARRGVLVRARRTLLHRLPELKG